jgi:hypothetical protein
VRLRFWRARGLLSTSGGRELATVVGEWTRKASAVGAVGDDLAAGAGDEDMANWSCACFCSAHAREREQGLEVGFEEEQNESADGGRFIDRGALGRSIGTAHRERVLAHVTMSCIRTRLTVSGNLPRWTRCLQCRNMSQHASLQLRLSRTLCLAAPLHHRRQLTNRPSAPAFCRTPARASPQPWRSRCRATT